MLDYDVALRDYQLMTIRVRERQRLGYSKWEKVDRNTQQAVVKYVLQVFLGLHFHHFSPNCSQYPLHQHLLFTIHKLSSSPCSISSCCISSSSTGLCCCLSGTLVQHCCKSYTCSQDNNQTLSLNNSTLMCTVCCCTGT